MESRSQLLPKPLTAHGVGVPAILRLNGPQLWSTVRRHDHPDGQKSAAGQWFLISDASLGSNPSSSSHPVLLPAGAKCCGHAAFGGRGCCLSVTTTNERPLRGGCLCGRISVSRFAHRRSNRAHPAVAERSARSRSAGVRNSLRIAGLQTGTTCSVIRRSPTNSGPTARS
jgi:hypothetical protein